MYSDINHLFIVIFCFILVNQNLLHGGGGLGYILGGKSAYQQRKEYLSGVDTEMNLGNVAD